MVLASLLQDTNAATITHSTDLKCGKCIKGGYNFCFQGNDSQQFDNSTAVTSTCCSDTSCSENTNTSFTCSSIYSDKDYALTMCPFKKNKCGTKQNVTFSNTNKSEEVKVKNLTSGESCTYMIKSSCGSPAFNTKNFSGMNDSNVNITFIEFEKDYVKDNMNGKNDDSTSTSNRDKKQPSDDKPNRN